MDVFRTPDERFDDLPGYPYEPHYVEVDGLRLHHLDEGSGSHGALLPRRAELELPLPAHARRASSRAGTGSCARTSSGFGRSDKPTDQDWYTYERHVRVRSPGTSTRSSSTTSPWSCRTGAGRSGCAGRSEHADQVGAARDPEHRPVHRAGEQGLHGLARLRRAHARPADRHDHPGRDHHRPAPGVVAAYEAPFPTPESKAGAQRFPLLVPLTPDDPGVAEMQLAVRTRCRAGTSRRWSRSRTATRCSPTRGPASVFTDLIPTAGEQVRIEGAAHFLQEDRGRQIADGDARPRSAAAAV